MPDEYIPLSKQQEPLFISIQQQDAFTMNEQQAEGELIQQEQQEQQPAELRREENTAGRKARGNHELTAEQLAEKERIKRLEKARKKDDATVSMDKFRHGFYNVIKGAVSAFKATKKDFGVKEHEYENNTLYMESLTVAKQRLEEEKLKAIDEGRLTEFLQKRSEYENKINDEVRDINQRVYEAMEAELEAGQEINLEELRRRVGLEMDSRMLRLEVGQQQKANVTGGTKPISTQYAADGSKWLVKDSLTCLGLAMPTSSILTESGYKIQKLVHPETAIEAFRGQSVGRGIVSYQRMVGNLSKEPDLFRFSRTPDAVDTDEMEKIQELTPQILREHTTDWLLCNFDTKGENFIIEQRGEERILRGIDKEASFRPVLDEGAQKMSSTYQRFDQNTVYNRIFQKFENGSMELELSVVETQINRVEQMSDTEYMAQFKDYISLMERKKPEKVEQIKENILKRKVQLRMEYREFFEKLVRERMKHVSLEETQVLQAKYLGGADNSFFRFPGETEETFAAEESLKERIAHAEEQKRLKKAAEEADKKDKKNYDRRHGFYDFSKNVVMGLKSAKTAIKNAFMGDTTVEKSSIEVSLAEIRANGLDAQFSAEDKGLFMQQYETSVRRLQNRCLHQVISELGLTHQAVLTEAQHELVRARIEQEMQSTRLSMKLGNPREIFLGGTKPMSEYYGSDGSKWLAKQAVNCMGYYKLDGALLTEAGAKLQKIVHPETAVEAFVGKTKQHGDVSFQRRLDNVESGPDKLDLFKFSKHPEIADDETIVRVQAIGSQILREHTTDWLLCNFDTKGENFIITKDSQGQRVLHGIDKEAAFSKILKPEAQTMSREYKPHTNNTLYNVVFTMYAQGKMDLELFDTFPQIQKLESMEDNEYLSTFQSYLDYVQAHEKPEVFDSTRANILRRKQNLKTEYKRFFTTLVNERCRTISPEAAVELKVKYFGAADGTEFRFLG